MVLVNHILMNFQKQIFMEYGDNLTHYGMVNLDGWSIIYIKMPHIIHIVIPLKMNWNTKVVVMPLLVQGLRIGNLKISCGNM